MEMFQIVELLKSGPKVIVMRKIVFQAALTILLRAVCPRPTCQSGFLGKTVTLPNALIVDEKNDCQVGLISGAMSSKSNNHDPERLNWSSESYGCRLGGARQGQIVKAIECKRGTDEIGSGLLRGTKRGLRSRRSQCSLQFEQSFSWSIQLVIRVSRRKYQKNTWKMTKSRMKSGSLDLRPNFHQGPETLCRKRILASFHRETKGETCERLRYHQSASPTTTYLRFSHQKASSCPPLMKRHKLIFFSSFSRLTRVTLHHIPKYDPCDSDYFNGFHFSSLACIKRFEGSMSVFDEGKSNILVLDGETRENTFLEGYIIEDLVINRPHKTNDLKK
jgi:hypothetical protein